MKVVINPKYSSAQAFITSLPDRFEQEGTLLYKERNVVKSFCVQGEEWIVKRYKTPNFIQKMAYSFWRKSKAARAYLFAEKLLSLGIDTPEGIAYIECKKGLLFCDGYFVSTSCYDPSLIPILREQADFDKTIANALAAFLVELHEKGVMHGDLNLSNILYHTDADGHYHFPLIDTNRSHFKSSLTPEECFDNLKRVTHRRDLLLYIVKQYALLRHWNVDDSIRQIVKALDDFEKRRRRKKRLKALFAAPSSQNTSATPAKK